MSARDRRLSPELRALLDRVFEVAPSMPRETAHDADWDAWADVDELQALLAGWASRGPEFRRRPDDDAALLTARTRMNSPAVRSLLGDRIEDADRLVTELYGHLR